MNKKMLVMTAAMKQETETITRCLVDVHPVETAACHVWQGNHGSTTVLALQTGIGKERAENALAAILDIFPSAAVISVGFGGALLPEQVAGDITICSDTVSHDPSGIDSGISHAADETLVRRVRDIKNGRHYNWRTGTGVTIPVIAGLDMKQELRDRYHADVCEMEDAWLAVTASKKNIPFMAVRVILDELHDDLDEYDELGSVLDGEGNIHPFRALRQLLAHPGAVLSLWSSYRNYRRARASLVEFIEQFLDTYK